MKENLYKSDVAEWFRAECILMAGLFQLDPESKEIRSRLGDDEEFINWFFSMTEFFIPQFQEFVFKHTNKTTVKRTSLINHFEQFAQRKKKDHEKEIEYRENNSYLYD